MPHSDTQYDLDSEALPITHGQTRLCLFPFTKLTLGKGKDGINWASYCCSQSARRYFRAIFFGEKPLLEVWNDPSYKSLRKSLLTGNNLPKACINCERHPAVAPNLFTLHIVLVLHRTAPTDELKSLAKKMEALYEEYKKVFTSLGVNPLPLPH